MGQMKTMQNQIQATETNNVTLKTSIEDFKTKLVEAKKKQQEAAENAEQEIMMGHAAKGARKGAAIRARQGPTKHMSRESGASYYFKNMQAQGLTSVAENPRSS